MEPCGINGGRFFLRPLSTGKLLEDRIRVAIARRKLEMDYQYVAMTNVDWAKDRAYTWACCEATNPLMAALVRLERTKKHCTIWASPSWEPAELLPNPDDLLPMNYADAARHGLMIAYRWAENTLGLTVRRIRFDYCDGVRPAWWDEENTTATDFDNVTDLDKLLDTTSHTSTPLENDPS